MKPLKASVSITLDEDVLENVRQLAEKYERSLSQYINLLLRRHLEKIRDKKE